MLEAWICAVPVTFRAGEPDELSTIRPGILIWALEER
jgi:hypothetical protein